MEQKNWKELLMKYKVYLIVIIIILLAGVLVLMKGCGSSTDTQPGEGGALESGPEAEVMEIKPENKLEENSHASVERMVIKFLDCLMSGDLEALEEITDYLSEEDRESVTRNAVAYESYSNLQCYTKNGPEEDSYIIFVTCDIKLVGIDTPAPYNITVYSPGKREDGSRYIRFENVEEDEALQTYVEEFEQDPEVKALYEDVKARYQQALESDKALYDFVQNVTGRAEEEAPAEEQVEDPEEEAPEEESPEEEAPEEEAPAESSEEAAAENPETEASVQNRETRVTESVNVRAEASTESERLALAYQGDAITQIESYDNGWSKVEYKGQTGYVKTEFLE